MLDKIVGWLVQKKMIISVSVLGAVEALFQKNLISEDLHNTLVYVLGLLAAIFLKAAMNRIENKLP